MPPALFRRGTVVWRNRQPTISRACTIQTRTALMRAVSGQQPEPGMAQYQAQLPAGLQALLEKNPEYFLRVFPTRRSAAAPQRIYDATRFNAQSCELISGGNGVAGVAAGIPFPLPQTGQEVIWNHIMRYRGDQISLSPTRLRCCPTVLTTCSSWSAIFTFLYGREGVSPQDLDNTLFYYKYKVSRAVQACRFGIGGAGNPRSGAGDPQGLALQPWRAPRAALADAGLRLACSLTPTAWPLPTWSTPTTARRIAMSGTWSASRKCWCRTTAMPCTRRAFPTTTSCAADTVNPELLRYELHRVWVVEADLRKGFSHPYAKRRFYIDEDSWQILSLSTCTTRAAS